MMAAFLQDAALFIALIIAVVVGLILLRIPIKQLPAWAKTKDGKGVIKGVVLAPLVIVIFAVIMFLLPTPAHAQFTVPGVPGTWLNDGHVFAGIDYTRKQSPQCHAGGFDDSSTSNMGFRLNVWESPSRNIRLNSKYTHHSCALNPDRNSYDALGVELEWYIWNRYAR